jgi:hypothetical protein
MAQSTVVIRVSYDKTAQLAKVKAPEMVTVWHVRRILLALTIPILLVWLLFKSTKTDDVELVQPEIIEPVITAPVAVEPVISQSKSKPAVIEAKPVVFEIKPVNNQPKPTAVIFDRRVLRAAVVSEFINDQPSERIKANLKVSKNQHLELFYFSEVKHLKNKNVSHAWFKNGQLVHKKHWSVKESIAKLISSYRFSTKDAGQWQVVLEDKNGKQLSETVFFVITE